MSAPLSDLSILQTASGCTVRTQEESYLFYNPSTDELHLVPPTGFFALHLCDGLRTVEEVELELGLALAKPLVEVRAPLRAFLSALLARGILELANES